MKKLAYTVKEVAQMMGCSRQAIYAAVKDGTLPTVPVAGKRVLIPAHRLEERIAALADGDDQ